MPRCQLDSVTDVAVRQLDSRLQGVSIFKKFPPLPPHWSLWYNREHKETPTMAAWKLKESADTWEDVCERAYSGERSICVAMVFLPLS